MGELIRIPVQPRAIRTRQALVAAAQLEFSENGYEGATARSIAERAKVATGSFYQYFRHKDEVLRELALDRTKGIGDRVVQIMERDAVEGGSVEDEVCARMRAVVAAVIDYHREDPGLHAVLTERRHVDPELDALTHGSERAIVAQIADLLQGFGHQGDREATAFVLFGMVEGAVHAHVLGTPMVSDERFTRALVDSMVRVAVPAVWRNER